MTASAEPDFAVSTDPKLDRGTGPTGLLLLPEDLRVVENHIKAVSRIIGEEIRAYNLGLGLWPRRLLAQPPTPISAWNPPHYDQTTQRGEHIPLRGPRTRF